MALPTDPFEAMGGGVYRDGGWKPRNMYSQQDLDAYDAEQNAAKTPAPPPAAAPSAPTPAAPQPTDYAPTLPSTAVKAQAGDAATYSQTPGAAPKENTANQGTQDVVRNSYLERATQGTNVSVNDQTIQAQAQPYAAAQDRARRQYLSEAAERASAQGLGDSGAMEMERRFASERMGQNVGLFEAELVGREIESRRAEIKEALSGMMGLVSNDQMLALQRELAALDAQMKELGITTGARTAADELALRGRDLDLRSQLGNRGLDLDSQRIQLQNSQFGDQLGFNIADREAYYSNLAAQALLNSPR